MAMNKDLGLVFNKTDWLTDGHNVDTATFMRMFSNKSIGDIEDSCKVTNNTWKIYKN